jgi:hypothetical protein
MNFNRVNLSDYKTIHIELLKLTDEHVYNFVPNLNCCITTQDVSRNRLSYISETAFSSAHCPLGHQQKAADKIIRSCEI